MVADIINIIEQAEQRQRARKAKDEAAFRSAVGLIVGDPLIAMETLKDQFFKEANIEPRLKVTELPAKHPIAGD